MFSERILSESSFDEVAIADFDRFQIAIPTQKIDEERRIFSHSVLVPKRTYSDIGWLAIDREIVALLAHIDIHPLESLDLQQHPIVHLGANVPISFETRSGTALPERIESRARFSCCISQSPAPYCSIFRDMRPRFVRVYPFRDVRTTIELVQQMLTDKAHLLAENRDRLKHSEFYKKQFEL